MQKPRSAYNYLWRAANKKRGELLGVPFGTGQRRLAKSIMYNLASPVSCFRCGKEVLIEDFSIDHKAAWQKADNPKEAFFDVSNIAFSHINCNMAEGGRMSGGEGHYKAKLTAKDVIAIRERWATGDVLLKDLALEYSLNTSSIWCAITGKTWKSIPLTSADNTAISREHTKLNGLKAWSKRSLRPLSTHCRSGLHEFTVENTIIEGSNRRCRACREKKNDS